MKTPEDKIRQARVEINAALAKRNRAQQLWQDADEELAMAKMKMEDALNEQKVQEIWERQKRGL